MSIEEMDVEEMNIEEYEQLSALVDDELADKASSSAINILIDNDEAKKIWTRYHLIRDVMRGRLPESVVTVTDAVKSNTCPPANVLPLRKSPLNFTMPVTGFAVAASILFIVILLNIQGNVPDFNQQTSLVTQADMDAQMNHYLVNYNEYRANSGLSSISPHVRLVASNITLSQ